MINNLLSKNYLKYILSELFWRELQDEKNMKYYVELLEHSGSLADIEQISQVDNGK